MTSYDIIIMGSSPNALTAAAYLARGGKKVLVLEPSAQVGGACSTTEFADGYSADMGIMSGRLNAEVIEDLKLQDHGLEVIERNSLTSLLPNGGSFTLPSDCDAACEVIGKLSQSDALKYEQFMQLIDLAGDFLQCAYSMSPPQNHPPASPDIQQLSELVGKLRGYGKREMTEVMRLLVMSIRDLLDEWFESAELKGLLASAAVRGLNLGPFSSSTSFNLLHQVAIGDGYFRATARGGIGSISAALSKAATSYGAEVRTNVGEMKVVVQDGTATGVHVNGETIEANTVISDYDALHTFTRLVAPPELEPEFNRALRHIRYNSAVARINLALSELPDVKALNVGATPCVALSDVLSGTMTVAPSLAYLERAFDGGKYGGVSEQPFLEVTVPSISDPSVAPKGKHVMSIWMQYAPYRNKLDSKRLLEVALAKLSEFFPDLKSKVVHSQVLTPQDFESRFHLSEGHLSGGEMNLAQAFYLRPLPGYAQYGTPIAGLHLCGAATHPGGMVYGLSGRNAARELGIKDPVLA